MSDAITFRRLRYTPFRDLARGRITGRLDLHHSIDAAGLPTAAGDLILRVVRRTRLRRIEKAAVADEFIAHFADGLITGSSVDDLIRDFGNERDVAKLIGRATRRNRSLGWHVLKYAVRAALVIIALDVVLAVRFLVGRPTVSVDYLSVLNAPIERVPQPDRAWPLYRQAILGLAMGKDGDKSIEKRVDDDKLMTLDEIPVGHPAWAALVAWIESHQPGMDAVRRAAVKPALGFKLGPGGDSYDPEIDFPAAENSPVQATPSALDESIVSILLRNLNPMRQMANLLSADLRVAREKADAPRVFADLDAMLGMASQLRDGQPFVVTQLVANGIDRMMLRDLDATLAQKPELLSDADLAHLAHRVSATVCGDTAAAFISLEGERMSAKDIIQRVFTDDGHGDGRLSASAVRLISILSTMGSDTNGRQFVPANTGDLVGMAVVGSVAASFNARRETADEFDRLYALADSDLARPMYAIDPASSGEQLIQRRIDEINHSSAARSRLILVPLLMPSLAHAQRTTEQLIGERDGALVAIAIELHRRRHNGTYPTSLDELVPGMLPKIPRDRITGDAIRYRLVDGKPVVYSVGVDRDDDGGRAPATTPEQAAAWPYPTTTGGKPHEIDGDWILYDGRPAKAPTTQPAGGQSV